MSETTFKSAEDFLADLGVERRPMKVELPEPDGAGGPGTPAGDQAVASALGARTEDAVPGAPATGAPSDPAVTQPLGEAVSDAVATVRRITAAAPASEGRIRRKLEERDLPAPVVEAALRRARDERLVDDDALAAALVAEWRAKGHAPTRLRADLRQREFDEDVVARAVAVAEDDEPLAAAFALARERAGRMRHVEAETAYRRIVSYLARRGHSEAVSRKAARDAVFDDRERERTAGR